MVALRRCRSVPPTVVEVNYDYGFGEPAARKAQRIHRFVTDDHDALSAASKRQDAALLRDISARMDTTDYRATPLYRRSRARARSRSPPIVVLGATHLPRGQRASSVPPSFRETECDADYHSWHHPVYHHWSPRFYPRYDYEDLHPTHHHFSPLTSYVTHRVRAGSEPPIDRRTSVYKTSHAHVPSADLAVRQARGALSRLERELSSGWDDPYYTSDYVHAPVRPYTQASHLGGISSLSYRPTTPVHVSTVRRSPSLSRYSRAADIEARLESMIIPDQYSSYAGLRSRAADARNKMDHHRVLLDRYLPVRLGPEPEVGMPQLERHRPAVHSTPMPTYTPSYRPAPVSTGRRMSLPSTPTKVERAPPRRPPMSDARKRAREVLCKTKGDPGYYDY